MAEALGELGDSSKAFEVAQLLKERSTALRATAARALDAMGEPGAEQARPLPNTSKKRRTDTHPKHAIAHVAERPLLHAQDNMPKLST